MLDIDPTNNMLKPGDMFIVVSPTTYRDVPFSTLSIFARAEHLAPGEVGMVLGPVTPTTYWLTVLCRGMRGVLQKVNVKKIDA